MGDFLAALKLLLDLVNAIKALYQVAQENQNEAWFKGVSQTIQALASAKTPEDRQNVAQKLRDTWGHVTQ